MRNSRSTLPAAAREIRPSVESMVAVSLVMKESDDRRTSAQAKESPKDGFSCYLWQHVASR